MAPPACRVADGGAAGWCHGGDCALVVLLCASCAAPPRVRSPDLADLCVARTNDIEPDGCRSRRRPRIFSNKIKYSLLKDIVAFYLLNNV